MFYEIVRKLPEGTQVILETSGDRAVLTIRAGRSRFTLQTLPESDFPDLAAGDMAHKFSLAAADLKRLINKTQFAISTEETRYYLNGIYLHAVGSGKTLMLRAVATDGHRLAQVDLRRPAGAEGMPGVIVPRKTVGEVQRLIEDIDGEVLVELSQAKIRFTVGAVVLTSKLIDGTFPDYGRVIPLGQRQAARSRTQGIRAGGRPRLDGVERARPRGEAVDLRQASSMLSVINPDSGSATEELEVTYDADPIDIGFNSRYLLDIAAQTRRRHRGAQARRSGLADVDRGQGRQRRALRADADAGVAASAGLRLRPFPFAAQTRAKAVVVTAAARIRRLTLTNFRNYHAAELSRRRRRRRPARSQRRRQDQPARSDLVARARARLAPCHARRSRLQRGRRVVGGVGRSRRCARPRHARHRHRSADRRRRAAAQMPRSTASRCPRLRPSPIISDPLAGAGDGLAVYRARLGTAALPRPAGAGDRRRSTARASTRSNVRCARATACLKIRNPTPTGSTPSNTRRPSLRSRSPRRARKLSAVLPRRSPRGAIRR